MLTFLGLSAAKAGTASSITAAKTAHILRIIVTTSVYDFMTQNRLSSLNNQND